MLRSELMTKIDEIAVEAEALPWFNLGPIYVCHIGSVMELTATNGSKCTVNVYASVTIQTKTWHRLTVKALAGVQEAKIKNSRRHLRNYIIDKYFSARAGCKGYHGYFKFVDLRMIRR